MSCYDCIPTEAEAKELHGAAVPLSRFMSRVTANRNSLQNTPNKPHPATTDAISLWDSYMLDINSSWNHRCHHFQQLQQTCCSTRRGVPSLAAVCAAQPDALATADEAAGVAEPSSAQELRHKALKRKSAPERAPDSQPPAARMRLQELQRAAATAIQEAEEAERLHGLDASEPVHSRGKVCGSTPSATDDPCVRVYSNYPVSMAHKPHSSFGRRANLR